MINYDIKASSHAGCKRTENQDRYLISSKYDQDDSKGCLIAVADGMGGHKGGGFAAQLAVTDLEREYYKNSSKNIPEALIKAFETVNQKIYLIAKENHKYEGMGTTLTALVLKENHFYFAHVGDSRGYIVTPKNIQQFTQDHSVVEELIQKGEITENEAENHPDRNIITRAIGTDPDVTVDISQKPLKLKIGSYVLICSDGLFKVIQKQEIKDIVHMYQSPKDICHFLIELANERGGPDNITVAVAIQNTVAPKTFTEKIKEFFI